MEMPNNMPGGMPPQMNNGMQRPQPGNPSQQIAQKVFVDLRNGLPQLQGGWQATLNIAERVPRIMNLISMLRTLNQGTNVMQCIQIAQEWEKRTILACPNKETYLAEMGKKLEEIKRKRIEQAGQMNLQASGAGGMMQNMGNTQNGINMQNNGIGNMGPFPNGGNMGVQPGQMNGAQGQNPMFPAQLQRQMQPSPLPLQQQQQQQNVPQQQTRPQPPQPQQQPQPTTMDPSALQMPPQQTPQQGQNMGQNNQPPPNMGQGGQSGPTPFQQHLFALAKKFADATPNEQKNQMRQKLLAGMTEQQRRESKGDPLLRVFMAKAQQHMMQKGQTGGPANQQFNQPSQNGPNAGAQMGNNGPPRPPSQAGGQGIDVNGFLGQQANAMKSQESGEQVVPASNNNNPIGFGGQMNASQGVNPAMLGNQSGQANQNNPGNQNAQNTQQGGNGAMNPNQMHLFMQQQRDAQHRERLQKQMMAQQHAMASRQQLQGQPGGLHTPNAFNGGANGQVNSPAMSMLNRPMVPPGQTTPGTPQPNRPRPIPQTSMGNDVNQLAQHHQNMLAQNSQQQQQQQQQQLMQQLRQGGQQQGFNNDAMNSMLARVPPEFRQRLTQMPHDQAKALLQRHMAMAQNRASGQPAMPNFNMGQLQPVNQQGQQAMPQQPMGNAIPGFNSHPPPNQGSMNPQDQIQQQIRNQQTLRLRAQALDARPLPPNILNQLGIAVPPQVYTWGDLKQHVAQNSPPGTLERVQQQQQGWFQANPQEFQHALQAIKARMQQQQQQQQQLQQLQNGQQGQPGQLGQARPQNGQHTPGSMPAPPAQMVPPAPMMQQPAQGLPAEANPAQLKIQQTLQPTPQDIAAFRSKFNAARDSSDDQIRQYIINARLSKIKNLQQQRAQMQNSNLPQAGLPNGAQPTQRTPQGQQGGTGQQKGQPQSNNDIIEISSQPATKAAQQAPPMQLSQSQQQAQAQRPASRLSQQEQGAKGPESQKQQQQYIQKMSQQQSAQMESIRKAQGQMGGAITQTGQPAAVNNRPPVPPGRPTHLDQERHERLSRMNAEVVRENPRGAPVSIDKAGMERMKLRFQKLYKPLQQMPTTFAIAMGYGFSDQRIKDVMRARLIVQQNVMDASGAVKDYLSVTPEQMLEIERAVISYMSELRQCKEREAAAKQQQQQNGAVAKPIATQAPPTNAHAAPMAPSSSQQNHARKSSKPPPAPTENKTFDWAAPSPHGVPKYDPGRNGLTPDKLKFPPQKKRKTDQPNSQASTPAAQTGTPAAMGASPALANTKVTSPEQARKTQAQLKAEAEKDLAQKRFRCKDATCDASLLGFETEDQLKQHEQSQHQVIENPLDFLLDNAANALGVDKEGKLLHPPVPATKKKVAPEASAKPRVATAKDLKKEELTKQELEQVNRGNLPASVKAKIAKKQAEFDAAHKDSGKELTLREFMSQKLDIPLPPEPAPERKAQNKETIEPILVLDEDDDSFTWEKMAKSIAEGWVQTDIENGVWEYRPGESMYTSDSELTPPGSESSQGSQSSDVSQSDAMNFMITMENWDTDMWGDGSGGAPESLVPLYRQMKDMMQDEDAIMGGTNEGGESPGSKKRKADEQWNLPVQDAWEEFLNGP